MKKHFKLLGLFALIFFSVCVPRPLLCQEAAIEKQIIESLEFREVDIKDVLRQLAKQFNLNIVFSEKVAGLVTVQLNNVTVDEALDSIVTVNGFVYSKKGTVTKVTTSEEAEREGKQTRLFKLNNADALKLKETLKKVLTQDGSIESDSRSNALVITDTLSVINKIEEMIPRLDELTPQVLIEAKLIETSLTSTEKLGIDWTTKIAAKGSKRPTTLPFDKWAKDNDFYPVPKYTSKYDTTTGQWTITSDFPFKGEGFFFPGPATENILGSFPMAAADQFTFGTLDFTSLQAVFEVLKTRSDTKLIANPRIVTLNNQEAKINVGKRVPLPQYTVDQATGTLTVTDWEYLDVGVNLAVTPQVSPDGHIKLKLKPEVSSLTGEFIGPIENQRPIYSTRIAETEVQIRDGQTVVIGGLVKNRSSNINRKIPVLGDIPILGFFFSFKQAGTEEDPQEKTDLLIFVTARIIKDTNEPLVAWERGLITSLPRPFKLEPRRIK